MAPAEMIARPTPAVEPTTIHPDPTWSVMTGADYAAMLLSSHIRTDRLADPWRCSVVQEGFDDLCRPQTLQDFSETANDDDDADDRHQHAAGKKTLASEIEALHAQPKPKPSPSLHTLRSSLLPALCRIVVVVVMRFARDGHTDEVYLWDTERPWEPMVRAVTSHKEKCFQRI